MTIYLLLILIILISYKIFKRNKKIFCIVVGSLFFILVCLRNVKLGLNDTQNIYYPLFNDIKNMSYYEILISPVHMEKLFYFITKLISDFINNYRVYISIMGIPYIVCVMYGIYRYSNNMLLSSILFLSLYYLYSFFLLKQVIAIGILFLSIKYLIEKKSLKFLICVLVATMFHRTSIIFLIAYPFCKFKKFDYKNYIFIASSFLVAKVFPKIVLWFISIFDASGTLISYINHGIYDTSGNISMFGLLITLSMMSFSYYYYKKNNMKDEKYEILLNLSTLGNLFYCFSPVVTEFYRVALYFNVFNVLLVTYGITLEKNIKIRKILTILIISVSILYFLIRTINNVNANPYIFFWE